MFNYLWPILLVIGANTLYNITAKSTPPNVNPFASLSITYLVGAVLSLILFFATSQTNNKTNWTAVLFGLAIVALEYGYINVYRLGWKLSIASLVANIGLACVLLVIGILFYKETVTLRQIAGLLVCAAGFFLLVK